MPSWLYNKPPITLTARKNLESVAQIEQEFVEQLGLLDRVSDAVARIAGSFPFIAVHALAFAFWIALNTLGWQGKGYFDPYPFGS
jgi:uncharacterized membrane protein